MPAHINKLALPALIGLVAALGIVGYWVSSVINASYRTDGTPFDRFAAHYPAVPTVKAKDAQWCDPAYVTRWAGCNIQ